MPYTVFICPHCQAELGNDLFQSRCNKCNQEIGHGLEEKVCYYPDEICQACGKSGGLIRISFLREMEVSLDLFGERKELQHYYDQKCNFCGAEQKKIVTKTIIPSPVKSISRPY